jgi:hypothetical protein
VDDNRHSWNIIPDVLVAIEEEGNSSARRITTRCGFAELDRNRFRIELPGKKEWDITFETDDDNYEKVKSILGAILSTPHHLVFGQNS